LKLAGDSKSKSPKGKIAGAVSTIAWVVGFVLTFAIPAGNRFVWLGDALLLIGFWPLLWLWRPSWPWMIFGVLNMAIGFLLEVAYFLPDTTFTYEMKVVRNHLKEQHSAITWILIGFVSTVFGLIRAVRQIWSWFAARARAAQGTASSAWGKE
jgi:hypothetical protein